MDAKVKTMQNINVSLIMQLNYNTTGISAAVS